MKKILFSLCATAALFTADALKAQTVLFEDNFESYTDFAIANVGTWTLLDVDAKPTFGFNGVTYPNATSAKSFQVFNSTLTTPPLDPSDTSDWTARSGVKTMTSFGANSAPWSNDWMISPQVQVTAGQGATVSFWAKSCDGTYGAEKFKVLVSTTGTAAANFTAITPVITTPSDVTWHEYTYSLNAYSGQQIYVAIQCTSDDQFGFAVDDFKIVSAVLPTVAPNCATQVAPANAATGVNYLAPATLSWTAPATGELPASYDVFFGTSANPTTLLINTTGTSTTTSALLPSTTYYWKAVAKNSAGSATGCTEFSFTTAANLFAPYCGPLTYSSGVEPITSVVFGGMTNTSAAALGGTAHESFVDKVANVTVGGTSQIKLQGNTGGAFTTKFIVFIDWNQDGDFLDAGETYFDTAATTVQVASSTGTDGKEAIGNIVVPPTALLGNTRMRIKKNFSATTFYPNPCFSAGTLAAGATTGYGQAEDYTVNVGSLIAVTEASKAGIKAYPNPVKDIFNIEAAGKIKSVKVYDVAGKQVFTKDINDAKSQIDFSRFSAGVYVVTTVLEDGKTTSTKVIKK
jgi:hypothetical protein